MSLSVNKMISNMANSKIVKTHIQKSIKDPKCLTGALVLTSVAKDVAGYSLRIVTDSRNDKIPEDKRHFLTDMNITNAVVSTVAQLGVAFAVSRKFIQNKLSKWLFAPIKDNPKAFKNASNSFLTLSTFFASTVLAKRIIVPTVATPIASAFYRDKEDKLHPKA